MKRGAYITLLVLIVASVSVGFTPAEKSAKDKSKPVNIILFIGDGMGPAQISAAVALSDNTLYIERFPYAGYCETSSSNNYVTDSAAGGTAIATGVKTKNGMIGMAPDSTMLTSIMELANKQGLSTGLVSTSAITHATPASFVAHNAGRGNYEDIALDFMNGTIDVFIGGGQDHFMKRKDNKDLTAELRQKGYEVVLTLDELKNAKSQKIAGLLDKEHMAKVTEGRVGMLEAMTEKAIEILSKNKNGFILMVEGSQIDFAGHGNDIIWQVSEVLDLDNAIGKAYDFAGRSKNTLVVVTADHETGGLLLPGGNLEEGTIEAKFGTTGHSAVMVPVFSYGPGAEKFSGILDNTDFFKEFVGLLNLKK
jgi:alkaline phosphatase